MRPVLSVWQSVRLPLIALALFSSSGAFAQTTLDGRVTRLEQEIVAVQRKVFPGGAGRFVEPSLTTPTTEGIAGGTPASSPIADLGSRVSAVEAQLRTLTGQVEQNSYKLRQLEEGFAQYKADTDAKLAGGVVAVPTPKPTTTSDTTNATPKPPAKPTTTTSTGPKVVGTGSDERKAAVAAVERPSTGNAPEDAYSYGYRLWTAKFYPEAQMQLKATMDKYGTTTVASRAQNLLGRAYLDDGKPALASVAFYENYQKRPKGERAAESLAYLGEALIQLKKLPDACKVYQELGDAYGATLSAKLKTMVDSGKVRAKCGA